VWTGGDFSKRNFVRAFLRSDGRSLNAEVGTRNAEQK
jgi:hypothetical protein